MSEHMMPIPSRLYNAAVGGHVAGADQIIDNETGLTLDKVTSGALEEKEYTSGSDNGMGRVVLRKNLVEGVNTLTQAMINKSNTIYVIQYDFTLGEDITVPADCILEFDGGSISVGSGQNMDTITGTNTGIDAKLVKIVNIDVTLDGTWNVAEAYPEWFGAKGDGTTDDTNALKKVVSYFSNIKLTKTYLMSDRITLNSNKTIIGHNATLLSNEPLNFILINYNASNIVIDGVKITGVAEGWPTMTTDQARASYLIKIVDNCLNVSITNCVLENATGGIMVTQGTKNLKVENNVFKHMVSIPNSLVNPTSSPGGYGVVLHLLYEDDSAPASINDITGDVVVNNNIFDNVNRHVFYPQVCKNVYFTNNIIKNSIINISGYECAISDCSVQNFIISENIMDNGISFWQYTDYSNGLITKQNISIENNEINLSNIATHIFRVHAKISGLKINNNIIVNSNSTGDVIRFNADTDNVIISNNHIECQLAGDLPSIVIMSDTADYKNIHIVNNEFISTNKEGFCVKVSYIKSLKNSLIKDNILDGGIRVVDFTDVSTLVDELCITGNTAKNSTYDSIRLSTVQPVLKNAIIKNNLVDKAVDVTADTPTNVVVEDNYLIVV